MLTDPVISEFQSRNREAFHFKCTWLSCREIRCRSFNLVIESLLISSRYACNRQPHLYQFQSRNRESFDFKCVNQTLWHRRYSRFNLVIESLLISSFEWVDDATSITFRFQSRNRESFDFKTSSGSSVDRIVGRSNFCFNLVIESLLISSQAERY